MENKIYQQVTDRIISELERGATPWIKPWTTFASAGEDQNIISKKPYNGINRVILGMSGFSSSKWASFKQWQQLGATVRKGEKGTMIVFYSPIKKESINPTNGQLESSAYHCLKSYFVFNADQVEGIEIEKPVTVEKPFIDIPALEKRVIDTGAIINHGSTSAFYRRDSDSIHLPNKGAFKSESDYYATLLHELIHWSGASFRLDRTKGKRFADTAYAFEELVAELGAAFLCQDYQIQGDLRHADYIGSWLKCLKDDNKAIFNAAALAQKAADYVNTIKAADNLKAA
jgi:antirestriction protein ArdC